jgi:hypothetical protein
VSFNSCFPRRLAHGLLWPALLAGLLPAGPALGRSEPGRSDSAAVLARLKGADLSEAVREAMREAVERAPAARDWAGLSGPLAFGVSVRRIPGGEVRERAVPLMLGATQMLAVNEMLLLKAILDQYGAKGLTETAALKQAVVRASKELRLLGRVKGMLFQARPEGDYAVAFVVADRKQLEATLQEPAELEKVRLAYRQVVHEQMLARMKGKEWKEAARLFDHLGGADLLTPEVALDGARCWNALENSGRVVRILQAALAQFAASASPDWLEACGDLALDQGEVGETVARAAYEKASGVLRNTRSAPKKRP